MSHELDFDAATGQANMFSRETPWHKEGHLLTSAPSYEEAITLANIGYEVETKPLRVILGDMSIDSPVGQAVVRMDRLPNQDAILGIVGDGYTPLQNREAFEILCPLLDAGLVELYTGGVLRKGADAWMQVKVTIKDAFVQEVFGGEIIPMILVSNNHAGTKPVTVMYTPVVVVCANTLGMAHSGRNKSNSMVIKKHTKTVRIRFIEESMKFFNVLMSNFNIVAHDYKALKDRILTVEEFEKNVLDEVSPFPTEDAEKTSHYDSVIARTNVKRDRISQMWEKGTGLTGNHSAWEAANAVAELLDYDEDMFKVRKTGSRIQSLVSGPLGDIKQRVLDNLVVLAKGN